jgi:hypothetical protein
VLKSQPAHASIRRNSALTDFVLHDLIVTSTSDGHRDRGGVPQITALVGYDGAGVRALKYTVTLRRQRNGQLTGLSVSSCAHGWDTAERIAAQGAYSPPQNELLRYTSA